MERAEAAEGAAWLQWRKGAMKKQVKRKRIKRTRIEKEESERKSPKEWLRASRRRQARMMMPRRLRKEQLGKVSGETATAHKSEVKKRKKRNSSKGKAR